MGRVSRYKKIKDPRKMLQKPPPENNLPENPEEDAKRLPRSLKNILWLSQVAEKRKQEKAQRRKSQDKQGNQKPIHQQISEATMKPGESYAQFAKRLREETKTALIEQAKQSSRKKEKRKEWLARKKRKREEKEEHIPDFSDLKDEIKFGEQVDRPPVLTFAPKLKKAKLLTPKNVISKPV